MLIGTISITGVNYTAGYYSKDAALFAAFQVGTESGYVAFAVGIFAAFLTSFYSWRLMFHTFFGEARWEGSEYVQHAVQESGHEVAADGSGGYHPHESGPSMLIPLALLSFGALFAGVLFNNGFVGVVDVAFWRGTIVHPQALYESLHHVPLAVHWAPFLAMVIGLLIAWAVYIRNPGLAGAFKKQFHLLHRFLINKWYFDELYDLLFIRFGKWLGHLFWQRGDRNLIDRYGPDGLANLIGRGSGVASRVQSGLVYSYALVMLIGAAVFITWFVVR